MREWSDSMQKYPEENAANYVNGRFDPAGAEALRQQMAAKDLAQLRAEVHTVAQKHRPEPAKAVRQR
jgi:hypothetical protein